MRKFYAKLALALVIISAVTFTAKQKKEMLVREGTHFLQRLLSRETQLDIKVGKISGRLSGSVRFDDVRLEDPALPAGLKLLLRAKRIEIRYRLLDLFTKKFSSKVTIIVTAPELISHPHPGLRHDRFGFFGWLKEWSVSQRQHVRVIIKDLKITQKPEGHDFADIQIEYADDAFQVRIPVRHLEAWGHDISTELILKGRFESAVLNLPDSVMGDISTEGTVVNWSPLPWESRFIFKRTPDKLKIESTDFLGGFNLLASIDLQHDDEASLLLRTKQYPLANFGPFLHTGVKAPLEGALDLEARVKGQLDAPHLEAYATITGGRSGANKYQSLNLYVEGVYPSLRLSDSRILFEDGKMMRFADQNVEFAELFDESIYKEWISGSDQETVVLGNWEFHRPAEEDEKQEFSLQRFFGKHASVNVKKANVADESRLDSPEKNDTQVGFEYRLKGKDTLKFEAREDERFVGVERKMSF